MYTTLLKTYITRNLLWYVEYIFGDLEFKFDSEMCCLLYFHILSFLFFFGRGVGGGGGQVFFLLLCWFDHLTKTDTLTSESRFIYCIASWCLMNGLVGTAQYLGKSGWLIVNYSTFRSIFFLLTWRCDENISLIWGRHHYQRRTFKFRPMFVVYGHSTGKDLYRVTPTVTWCLVLFAVSSIGPSNLVASYDKHILTRIM